jgi:uncharacterized lipoprotein YajG
MSKLALVLPFALLCACSPSHTLHTSNGSVTVTEKGNNGESVVHVAGKDGATLDINSGKAITDYPSDTPLYEGKSMMDMKAAEKHSRVVAIQTSDSLDKISDFYKSQLDSKGWKVESSINSPQMNSFVATKDSRKLVVVIGTDGKIQSVSQTLADK